MPLPGESQELDFFLNVYRTPPFLLPIYLAAAERYGVPWPVLAAINEVESDYGYDLGISSAGAEGWMQFLPSEWLSYGVDANGAGVRDPYNPADAIFATARYLAAAGAARNLSAAIYAYNHSLGYVESVILHARLIAGTPQSLISGLAAVVTGRFPVQGGGPHTTTAVWSAPASPSHGHSSNADRAAPTGAPAPPPALAGSAGSQAAGPAVTGVNIAAASGAAVVAVQSAQLIRVGRNAKLGRFFELRDAYGDVYTYAELGRVLGRYAPLANRRAASRLAHSARSTPTVVLGVGTWVAAGTVLGNVATAPPGAQANFLFEIQPAGAATIDPRPVLESWQLLAETQGHPESDTQPLFGPEAGNALIGEVQLMSKPQLQARLLSDSRLHMSGCVRRDIAEGSIDQRVLTALDYLLDSGLGPTVPALQCHGEAQGATARLPSHASADSVTITALNRVPIRGHDERGSLIELAAQRLLSLPAPARPDRIIGPLRLHGVDGTVVQPGSPDRLEIGFAAANAADAPAAPAKTRPTQARSQSAAVGPSEAPASGPSNSARPSPELGAAGWRKLITHISHLAEPHVPRVPTSAAVADDASSPPPRLESPAGSPTFPLPAAMPTNAAHAPTNATQVEPTPARGERNAPALDLRSSFTSGSAIGPAIVLETKSLEEGTEETDASVLKGAITFNAQATGLSSSASYEFQYKLAESPESGSWIKIGAGAEPDEAILRPEPEHVADGLYDFRVIVTSGSEKFESGLRDRLIANKFPVVTLTTEPGGDLRGTIELKATWPPEGESSVQTLESVSFQWAEAESPPGDARWHTIRTESIDLKELENGEATAAHLDTTSLPDGGNGKYDFRVVALGKPEPGKAPPEFPSIPIRDRLVDNAPPSVTLSTEPSSGPLHGEVTLRATATDPWSEVASVRFQGRSRVGTASWFNIGNPTTVHLAPGEYAHPFNTASLQNGPYELRAIAEDVAGNEATSSPVEVEVDNPSLSSGPPPSISGVLTPAREIGFLGAIENSPEHEAWAYGFTSAPPAEAEDGKRLEYTAEGKQLVLLRYRDKGGWQIADVLHEDDAEHTAFKLLGADKLAEAVHVTGAMAPNGEAWLWVAEQTTEAGARVVGLFHRAPEPNAQFVREPKAEEELKPLLGSESPSLATLGLSLKLGESNGHGYGMLTAPGQTTGSRLEYGLLQEGDWSLQTAKPPPELLQLGHSITLKVGDIQGPGAGWGALEVESEPGLPLILGHFEDDSSWTFFVKKLGLDALDLTGDVEKPKYLVSPKALKAEGDDVWIEALVGKEAVIARFEPPPPGSPRGRVTNSWCTLPVANECEEPIKSPGHEAAVPEAIFPGPVALALKNQSVDTFANGQWTSVAAPGYALGAGQVVGQTVADAVFSSPTEGWLGGTNALGHWSTEQASGPLVSWPLPDRSPLTSVALPPGGKAGVGESGALAVGFKGTTLSYDASSGWLAQPTPPGAQSVDLLGVAFAGPSSAFAVGTLGAILHWNGAAWSEDPQSFSLTDSQLNAVAFAPSGEGWAVGGNGTILHYDGHRWSIEPPPAPDSGVNITSVAVAGSEVFAVAGGNLITRSSNGWVEVAQSELPSAPVPTRGSLRLVAGLPDGGVVVAGRNLVLDREAPGQSFAYAPQPLQGIAVALAPFRQADGKLGTYVSVAPPAADQVTEEVAGFPPGDGELLRQTDSGWQDISHGQYAGGALGKGDGALKNDPVLAVAVDPTGEHAWAVGGYDGTEDAAGQGSKAVLPARPSGWQTASIWRYDATGSAQPPGLTSTPPSLPAKPGTVSFAFFTSPMCRTECASSLDAQPAVNLTSASRQIAAYAAQPGGPAFAMLGGNAVGPVNREAFEEGDGKEDFADLPGLVAPLGNLPLFAALGEFDYVRNESDETRPWAEAFSDAPPPFGSGPAAQGITPVPKDPSGGAAGEVHRYYAFDAEQNGGTLRVIVLDNSKGSLEASDPGQRHWLEEQLEEDAHPPPPAEPVPVVVVTALPLTHHGRTSDGAEVASLLASSGVLAVFSTNGSRPGAALDSEVRELDEQNLVPEGAAPGAPQIPEYEGATLGYQQSENNGVTWYLASIDTQARTVQVSAIPVLNSLSLKAIDGLNVARSLTLQFEAIGRRPAGTLATIAEEGIPFEGYDEYAEIPAPPCSNNRACLQPSYSFTSSEPSIGEFVVPEAPKSLRPKLDANDHPIPSSTSGLFCAYNSGTTTVTITAGLLSYSLPVTVAPGGYGRPCGTVYDAAANPVVYEHLAQGQQASRGAAAPPPPPSNALQGVNPSITAVPPAPPAPQAPPAVPPVAPKPVPPPVKPAPAPSEPFTPVVTEPASPTAALVPPAAAAVEPIPPGGTAQAPSAAERREKARKHASESAYTLRPAGVSGEVWFYGAVGLVTLLALMLSARAIPAGPRPRPALLFQHTPPDPRRRRS